MLMLSLSVFPMLFPEARSTKTMTIASHALSHLNVSRILAKQHIDYSSDDGVNIEDIQHAGDG